MTRSISQAAATPTATPMIVSANRRIGSRQASCGLSLATTMITAVVMAAVTASVGLPANSTARADNPTSRARPHTWNSGHYRPHSAERAVGGGYRIDVGEDVRGQPVGEQTGNRKYGTIRSAPQGRCPVRRPQPAHGCLLSLLFNPVCWFFVLVSVRLMVLPAGRTRLGRRAGPLA
jgi:hypothetical protein